MVRDNKNSIYLETARLILREMQRDEQDLFFDLDSDPDVVKYITGGKTSSMEECVHANQRTCNYYEKYDHKFGLWIAEERETGEFIGWFILRPDRDKPEDTDNPELGYRFKKKFWGKGYATEGSRALVAKAFSEFGCKTVYAVAMTGNRASQNVMKKVGMTFRGDFPQEDCCGPNQDTSAVRYQITKCEWDSLKKEG